MHQPVVLTALVLEALCYCGAASSAAIVRKLAIIVIILVAMTTSVAA